MFVLCMIPLLLLKEVKAGYDFGRGEKEIWLPSIDSTDIQWRYLDGIWNKEKYGVTTLKRRKLLATEWIKLQGWKVMKEIDDAGYKYLGIPQYGKVKQIEMRDIFWGNIIKDWRWY